MWKWLQTMPHKENKRNVNWKSWKNCKNQKIKGKLKEHVYKKTLIEYNPENNYLNPIILPHYTTEVHPSLQLSTESWVDWGIIWAYEEATFQRHKAHFKSTRCSYKGKLVGARIIGEKYKANSPFSLPCLHLMWRVWICVGWGESESRYASSLTSEHTGSMWWSPRRPSWTTYGPSYNTWHTENVMSPCFPGGKGGIVVLHRKSLALQDPEGRLVVIGVTYSGK